MKNTVFISSHLSEIKHGSLVSQQLCKNLPEYGYDVKKIEVEVKNEWCRDFMPIRTKSGKLVQFKYNPSYMAIDDDRIPDVEKIHHQLNLECKGSTLILDGGAIEILEDIGIVSDRVFRDNLIPEDEITKQLMDRLELVRLIVVPQHPYDFTGHVDGLVRFINKGSVLINDLEGEFQMMKSDTNTYRKKLIEQWYYSFKMSIYNSGLDYEELVCTTDPFRKPSDAFGIYLNFLLLGDLILVPGFEQEEIDEKARLDLKRIYQREAITIQAQELAKKGGIINCVTWN